MGEVAENNQNNDLENENTINSDNNTNENDKNAQEQNNEEQTIKRDNICETFNFKAEFRKFYDNAIEVEKDFNKYKEEIRNLSAILCEKGIEEFYKMGNLRGIFSDMENRWLSSIDIAKKINSFLDGGLSNETLNNLNEFITIAESSKIAKDNFLEFDRDLEIINKKLKDFNQNVKNYEIDTTMEAIAQENQKIVDFINSVSEKSEELLKGLVDFRTQKIESLRNATNESIENIHQSINRIEDTVQEVEDKSVEKLSDFDKKFKDIFENKLVTWKDINIKNYKNFTKFAFGFYAANFLVAVILGGLCIFMIESKKAYDIQAQELLEANEAYHFLIENGDLNLEKQGDQISLNFVAKQNISIRQDGQSLHLTTKEKR